MTIDEMMVVLREVAGGGRLPKAEVWREIARTLVAEAAPSDEAQSRELLADKCRALEEALAESRGDAARLREQVDAAGFIASSGGPIVLGSERVDVEPVPSDHLGALVRASADRLPAIAPDLVMLGDLDEGRAGGDAVAPPTTPSPAPVERTEDGSVCVGQVPPLITPAEAIGLAIALKAAAESVTAVRTA